MAKAKAAARKRGGGQSVVGGTKGKAAAIALYKPLKELVPYARNAQVHTPQQIDAIAKSIERFGFAAPVLADAKGILAGHGRVLAAAKLYSEGKTLRRPDKTPIPAGCVPVIDCGGMTDDERRSYILADNQLGRMAQTDDEAMRDELSYLQSIEGDDLAGLAGFDEVRISEAMASADGWAPDFNKIEKAPPAMADLMHTFKVTCKAADQEAVKAHLEKALAKLQIEGVVLA